MPSQVRRLLKAPRTAKFAVAALLAAGFLTLATSFASAQTAAPPLSANFASCYREIITTGDLLCVIRYELPTYETVNPPATPEAWCALLVDKDGCIDDPVSPTAPTTLEPDSAYVVLRQGSTFLSQSRVPRIDHGLAGVYISPGHGLTWGDATIQFCAESNPTTFSPTSQDCYLVWWNTAIATQAAQRAQLGSDLVLMVLDLQTVRGLPVKSYVVNSKLTTAGQQFATEIFPGLENIIPEVYQAAAVNTNPSAFATAGPSNLQNDLDTTSAGTGISAAFTGLGSVFGLSGGAIATLIFLVVGVIVFVVIRKNTEGPGSIVLAVVGLMTVAMIGVFVRAPSVSVIAVMGVLFAVVGGIYIMRRLPS